MVPNPFNERLFVEDAGAAPTCRLTLSDAAGRTPAEQITTWASLIATHISRYATRHGIAAERVEYAAEFRGPR